MIKIDDCEIEFSGTGLFLSDDRWIHPGKTELSYEIIYVVCGEVYIKEGEKEYSLKKGDLIILKPGIYHEGFKESTTKTSFYWLHFFADGFSKLPIREGIVSDFEKSYLFKEILHHRMAEKSMIRCEMILTYILSELFCVCDGDKTRLAAEVFAWVNANATAKLTVKKTGEHFGYNAEHLSRVVKTAYRMSLKALINRQIIFKANNYLSNSGYSVKEIANLLEFENANAFVCFYKYHTKTTPVRYRNTYSLMKINKR